MYLFESFTKANFDKNTQTLGVQNYFIDFVQNNIQTCVILKNLFFK
jgi:hypothetical protein